MQKTMSRAQPKYQIVRNALQHRIETGVLRVGDQLPSEEAIALEFDCSRLTAHRAVRELAADGLVERRRRAGTRVLPRERGGVLIRIPLVREEIEALGGVYRYELIDRRILRAPGNVAAALGLDGRHKLLNLRCRHWADRSVWQYEDRWINPDAAPAALEQDFAAVSPNQWLLRMVPYSDVDHEITAISADAAQADWLGVPEGAPLLRTRRVTSLHGAGVTLVTLLHPGHSYVLRSAPQGMPQDRAG